MLIIIGCRLRLCGTQISAARALGSGANSKWHQSRKKFFPCYGREAGRYFTSTKCDCPFQAEGKVLKWLRMNFSASNAQGKCKVHTQITLDSWIEIRTRQKCFCNIQKLKNIYFNFIEQLKVGQLAKLALVFKHIHSIKNIILKMSDEHWCNYNWSTV